MKHAWIVLLFAACVVRISPPFRLPPPDPDGEPPAAGAAQPDPRSERVVRSDPRGPRRSAAADPYDQNHGWHHNLYWNVHREFTMAREQEAAHHDDEAAGYYHSAAHTADELLTSLAQHPDPTSTYSTDSDGVIDEPTLIAKTRELRARAQQLGDAAEQRYHDALFAEFHPRTAEQRKVLLDHGRPEVLHRSGHVCWQYLEDGVQEVFCWNRSGQLARHDTSTTAVASRHPGDGRSTQPATDAEHPKARLHTYYPAAAFATGSCNSSDCFRYGWSTRLPSGESASTSCNSSDCTKYGWSTRFPDGESASTSCNSSDCMKYGWSTRFPDGESASTSCNSSDCTRYGWSTRFPDGESASTSCNSSDCTRYGWSTRLPSGDSISCSCNSSDCTRYGASCH